MIISIRNLPEKTTLNEVRHFFPGDKRLVNVHFSDTGNPHKLIAWVKFNDLSRTELNQLVHRLNNYYYKNQKLHAYAPLFFN
ncbi:MAG: RNA recognition motif domain-containing protein [Pontibacterium sp.]